MRRISVRSQWRDRAGFAPRLPGHPPLNAARIFPPRPPPPPPRPPRPLPVGRAAAPAVPGPVREGDPPPRRTRLAALLAELGDLGG